MAKKQAEMAAKKKWWITINYISETLYLIL